MGGIRRHWSRWLLGCTALLVASGVQQVALAQGLITWSSLTSTGASEAELERLTAFDAALVDTASSPESLNLTALQSLVPTSIDPRRSLFVTDTDIVAAFSLQRVMESLVEQANGRPRATGLFQQWWDIMNPSPGQGSGPHCDDQVDPELGPVLNSYPYSCRPAPAEGAQAECTSFNEAGCQYIPVAVVNRLDLAPADGSTCGEFRIIHAKSSGATNPTDRNLVIWEAAVPNPFPRAGRRGCGVIALYWSFLSVIDQPELRSRWLERFFFDGVGPIEPAVSIANYGANRNRAGQVRTNQFMGNSFIWNLREFQLDTSTGVLRFTPVTAKTNPWGGLFAADASHPAAASFSQWLPGEIPLLSASDPNDIFMNVPDRFNSGQSMASNSNDTDYLDQFGQEDSALRGALETELAELGSDLTAEHIVARAQTQSCAGCHQLSNGADLGGGTRWPSSLGFTHVSEQTEVVDGVTRFRISPAVEQVFLPARQANLERFLRGAQLQSTNVGAVN